jgi:hypothetical protein
MTPPLLELDSGNSVSKKEAILVVEVVLLYADNTLIMCDIDDDQILNLDHIFLCFETIRPVFSVITSLLFL